VVNASFPAARLREADVVRTWAGLRPLIADRRGRPSDISRRHVIRMPQPGWLDVAGGKLTTYRLIAQQAVNRLARHLGGAIARCRTAAEPLYDAAGVGPPCGVLPPAVGPEPVQYACRHEWAVHLDDVMLRRTSWHYYHADAGVIASQVAAWMAEVLGWDAAQRQAELARYQALANGERGAE
jgi:glycerol-3-phosphate dehydrogenase